MARPRKEIDFDVLKKLCNIQCTAEEVSQFFEVSLDTLNRRLREKYKIGFAVYFKKNSAGGKISLRRNQFNLSKKSAGMAIFLGKNYLGQKDHFEDNEEDYIETVSFKYTTVD